MSGELRRVLGQQHPCGQHRRSTLAPVEYQRRRAASLIPVRSTLVAPMLPEPISRRFSRPIDRVTITPNGTDPTR